MILLGVSRQVAGRASRSRSSPLVPGGCGLSTSIPYEWVSTNKRKSANAIKAAHRYAVQVSDTTMLTIAASLPGQYSMS